jgi:Replication-relaxation
MTVTERDKAVLRTVAHYYTLTRQQLGSLCFPDDGDGRITRNRLQKLLEAGLLNRTRMEVINPAVGAGIGAPVYYPSRKGCEFLAQETADDRYLAASTHTPNWQHLYHWVAVAQFHILVDQAAALAPMVSIEDWYGEWSIANPNEELPEKRYRLYTLVNADKPRVVCVPDAAFLVGKAGFRKVMYVEMDRDTTREASRVIAQKAPGYAGLAKMAGHLRHFPTANVEKFSVLMITPTDRRRDSLLKAVQEKEGAALWFFASLSDLTPETLLFAPVFRNHQGESKSLVIR